VDGRCLLIFQVTILLRLFSVLALGGKRLAANSPYDEVLDSHGIGDHCSVAGFGNGIHVLNDAFVYHHQKLQQAKQTITVTEGAGA
jgi:hypothetical protein